MKSIDIESINNSKQDILIPEKSDNLTSENKKTNIKNITELSHYIKDFKLCNTLDLLIELGGSCYLKKEEQNFNMMNSKNTYLDVFGFMAGLSLIFFPVILLFGYNAKFPGIVYLIIYIILVILQLFNPIIKKLFRALKKKEDFEEFKNFINPIIKNNLSLINRSKFDSSNNYYDFEIKNCIDITGEIDMTKPPEFFIHKTYDNVRREINSVQKKLNTLVAINICPVKIYIADKATERKLELYCKNIAISWKEEIKYRDIYFRNFNFLFLLSIPLLSSTIFFKYLDVDIYNIEPKKLISCEQDLDSEYFLSLCSNFKPKITFFNGDQIIYKENCVSKADEKKLKIFNDNYSRTLGKKDEIRKKFIELGYKPKMDLYKNTLGNLKIHVYVNEYYNIQFNLQYELKHVEYVYTLGRNEFSFESEVNLNCTKEGLEKKGELNYLYIKYLEQPIIFGNYEQITFMVEFDGAKTMFGPELIRY